MLREEEALLSDLNGRYGAIRFYLERLVEPSERSELRVEVHQVDSVALEFEGGLAPRHRDIRDGDVIIDAPPHSEYLLGTEVDNMYGFRRTIYVRLEDHVGRVHRAVQVQQEDGEVGVRGTAHHEIQTSFAQLTVQVLPVVG